MGRTVNVLLQGLVNALLQGGVGGEGGVDAGHLLL